MPAVTKADLCPADNDHGKAEQRGQMEEIEMAGEVVNAKRGKIKHEHGTAISNTKPAMLPGSLGRKENENSKTKAEKAESDGQSAKHIEHSTTARALNSKQRIPKSALSKVCWVVNLLVSRTS